MIFSIWVLIYPHIFFKNNYQWKLNICMPGRDFLVETITFMFHVINLFGGGNLPATPEIFTGIQVAMFDSGAHLANG